LKKPTSRSEELLRIARLYYTDNLSKTAIAAKVKLSVTHVKRLLVEAREMGIVRIEYVGPRDETLARKLVAHYPCLREAVVVGTENDYLVHTRTLARAAAEYFDEYLASRRTTVKVGLSGGLTVFEFVKALPEQPRNITLYPTAILGRGDTILNHIDPIASLMTLWGKSGYREGGLYFVTITPLEKNPKGKSLSPAEVQEQIDRLRQRNKVARLYESMSGVDMVFASLRQLGVPDRMKKRMGAMAVDLLSDIGLDERDLQGAVGDVNYSFIDEQGESRKEWRLFLSLQAEQLRQMAKDPSKRVVVIAGQQKLKILRAALKGRLLNVLITDEITAAALLTDPVSAEPMSGM